MMTKKMQELPVSPPLLNEKSGKQYCRILEIGEIQPYMFEPETDEDEEEQLVYQNRINVDPSEWNETANNVKPHSIDVC